MNRPKIKVNYCITRNGIIQFPKSLASDNQCVTRGHEKYHYTCKVYTDNKKLDPMGFIVDHNDIDRIITTELVKQKFKGSCELMSEAIIGVVIDLLKKKKQRFKSIEITLKGKPEGNPAFIVASYTNLNYR